MKIYILGIGGTLMSGIAMLAQELGHSVRGCDKKLYPPMSEQLSQAGIDYDLDYLPEHLNWQPDLVIVGNTITASSPIFIALQQLNLDYLSAPQWLHENILVNKRVVAVSGTHGKTTTTAILVHLLKRLNIDCGYLIAGAAQGLNRSAIVGTNEWFIIEADEYDTACFDKVPKFMHYHPDILLINNLEFDHADIYKDYNAIEQAFIDLLKILKKSTITIVPDKQFALAGACSAPKFYKNSAWQITAQSADAASFSVTYNGVRQGDVTWPLLGEHNLDNLRAALCVLSCMDIEVENKIADILLMLATFAAAARRLQDLGEHNGCRIIDDFAHHPTAIKYTIDAVKNKFPGRRLVACLGFASYSMRNGVHFDRMPDCLAGADFVVLIAAESMGFELSDLQSRLHNGSCIISEDDASGLLSHTKPGDVLLFMSNRGLPVLHRALVSGASFNVL